LTLPGATSKAAAMAVTRRSARKTDAPPERRSRKEQGEQTRRAILDAAVALYAENGVRGTGLMAIGERAGVHHATVLYHFGSSHGLLVAVLEERDRMFFDFSRGAFRDGGLAALRALPVVARFHLANPLLAKLFTVLQVENLDADAEVHAHFLSRRRGARQLLSNLVAQGQQRGEIRADADPARIADTVLAFMAGSQVQSLLDPATFDLLDAYDRFTAMLVRDLAPGGKLSGGGRTGAAASRRG
jgi:AcrR family transcriptional regulator